MRILSFHASRSLMVRKRAFGPAFTLIELLAVIAIVSLLAAIIIPVIKSVRESAMESESVANLRQLGVASQLYLTDHNQVMYPHNKNKWYYYLNPYLKNVQIDSSMKARDYTLVRPSVVSELPDNRNFTGYGKNGNLGMLPNGNNYVKRINEVYPPSKVVVFWEETHEKGNADGGWPTSGWSGGGGWYSLYFGHSDQCKVLLLDGHVESLNRGENGNALDYPNLLWGPFDDYPNVVWSDD